MNDNSLDQSTLVLNWTRGPQQGRSLNILKKKCLLKWRGAPAESVNEHRVPALAIIQGSEGVALRAFGDAIQLNGVTAECHWLRHGDRLIHERFEAQIEFRCDHASTLDGYHGVIASHDNWDRLNELLEQMSSNREHSNRMTRKIKSLAKQTRRLAGQCKQLDSRLSETSNESLQSINAKLDAVWEKLSTLVAQPSQEHAVVASMAPGLSNVPAAQEGYVVDAANPTMFQTNQDERNNESTQNVEAESPWSAPAQWSAPATWSPPATPADDVADFGDAAVGFDSNELSTHGATPESFAGAASASGSPFAELTSDWQVEELTWNTPANSDAPVVPTTVDFPETLTSPATTDSWNIAACEISNHSEAAANSASDNAGEQASQSEVNQDWNQLFSAAVESTPVTSEQAAWETHADETLTATVDSHESDSAATDEQPVSVADMWNHQEQQFAELEQQLAQESAPVVPTEQPENSEVDLQSILQRLRQIESNFQQEQDRNATMCLNDTGLNDLLTSHEILPLTPPVSDATASAPTEPSVDSSSSLDSWSNPMTSPAWPVATNGLTSDFSAAEIPANTVSEPGTPELSSALAQTPAADRVDELSQLYESAIHGNHENDAWMQLMQCTGQAETVSPAPVAQPVAEPVFDAQPATSNRDEDELNALLAKLSNAAASPAVEPSSPEWSSESSLGNVIPEVDSAQPLGEIADETNRNELSRLRADLAMLFGETAGVDSKPTETNDAVDCDANSCHSELSLSSSMQEPTTAIGCLLSENGILVAGEESATADCSDAAAAISSESPVAPAPIPNYVPPEGAEHDDGVTNYMNQLFQRLRGGSAPAPAAVVAAPTKAPTAPAPTTPALPKANQTEETEAVEPTVANTRVEFMAPDEFKPKQQAPERNTDMNALRNLANASVRSALDEFAEKQKHGLAALRYATAGGGLAFSVVLFAASNAIGDVWFLGGCGCILASVASFLWHYRVVMNEARQELLANAETPEQNPQARWEARLAEVVQEPTTTESRPE